MCVSVCVDIYVVWMCRCMRGYIYSHTRTGSSSIVLFDKYSVSSSYICTLKGQVFTCRYIFVAISSFTPPVVCRHVFEKVGCAAGQKRLRNTGLDSIYFLTCYPITPPPRDPKAFMSNGRATKGIVPATVLTETRCTQAPWLSLRCRIRDF
jgi:hypothetical protein